LLKILILDRNNSIRSQILEAYLNKILDKRAQLVSAGIEATGIDPQAIRIMAEDGFVIAGQNSKTIEEVEGFPYDTILYCSEGLQSEITPKREDCKIYCGNFPELDGFGGVERLSKMRIMRDELKGFAHSIAERLFE
jgi:protein-tyrosine-phosphatase